VPRFVIDAVHRNISLLALAFLTVHITTAVLDVFAPIRLIDAVIPFTSAYRPLWLGLGTLASDLLIAVAITSILRRRLGYGAWRATHWLAYASWPIAVVHGLGTGSDAKTTWMLALTAASVVVVLGAVAVRVSAGWPDHSRTRVAAAAVAVLVPIGLIAWLPGGPLGRHWAQRAGTPAALLAPAATAVVYHPPPQGGTSTSFTTQAAGTVRHGPGGDEGPAQVHISLRLAGQGLTELGIRIFGEPLPGGGIQMEGSRVALGTAANPELYRGVVTGLSGTNVEATVTSGTSRLSVAAQLQLNQAAGTATGTVRIGPA
jgi:methionine sulfoxide reductase heme-binding subunit